MATVLVGAGFLAVGLVVPALPRPHLGPAGPLVVAAVAGLLVELLLLLGLRRRRKSLPAQR